MHLNKSMRSGEFMLQCIKVINSDRDSESWAQHFKVLAFINYCIFQFGRKVIVEFPIKELKQNL